MNQLLPSQKIYITNSKIPKAGRGVFAKTNLHKDDVIEVCPVLLIPHEQIELLRKTEIHNYYFLWGDHLEKVAIAFGFGSLYNHSYQPNATYIKKMKEGFIEFVAIKAIKANEEITTNYNHGNPEDKSPLWIKSIPRA